MNNYIENNIVTLQGEIASDFVFSHEVFGEGFYMVNMSVKRLSGQPDIIPLMVSERLVDVTQSCEGMPIKVSGQFRSYNKHEGTLNRLILSVFVRDWEYVDEDEFPNDSNQIFLEGYVCKVPVYRKTPFGREIADLLVAVNRPYGKSDYIPCIAWGRNARYAPSFQTGVKLRILGRIQSREYIKNIGENECEKRIAYEVSVSKVEVLEDER